MLGRNHIVQIEPKSLFKDMSFGLSVLLGNRNKLVIELGVDLRSELLSRRGWHGFQPFPFYS